MGGDFFSGCGIEPHGMVLVGKSKVKLRSGAQRSYLRSFFKNFNIGAVLGGLTHLHGPGIGIYLPRFSIQPVYSVNGLLA